MDDVAPDPVYANVVRLTPGPFDLVMDFGFSTPEHRVRQSTEFVTVARIAMSLGHAKSMLPLLAKAIADYEKQVGEIPSPGFEQGSKE
jgi:hypothetical protein